MVSPNSSGNDVTHFFLVRYYFHSIWDSRWSQSIYDRILFCKMTQQNHFPQNRTSGRANAQPEDLNPRSTSRTPTTSDPRSEWIRSFLKITKKFRNRIRSPILDCLWNWPFNRPSHTYILGWECRPEGSSHSNVGEVHKDFVTAAYKFLTAVEAAWFDHFGPDQKWRQ